MPRTLLIFVFILPLAVLMGFMLADPLMSSNMAFIGGVMLLLLLPIALAAHHTALIWVSGAYMSAFFLPGRPQMWMIMACFSFVISLVSRPLAKHKMKPLWPRSLAGSLIFLLIVVVVTGQLTGGVGLQILGSQNFGGRKYVWVLAAIAGFFALSSQTVPRANANREVTAFCLSSVTAAVSNLVYMLGPSFYFLYLLFPVELAVNQASADLGPVIGSLKRISGFGPAAIGMGMFCLTRWGIRGLLDFGKPYRMLFFLIVVFGGLLSGFRSTLTIIALVFAIQFFAEGLHRTRYATVFLITGISVFVFLSLFATSLPLAAQRAVSFLPVKVDPTAEVDAKGSIEWRMEMWRTIARDIPRYFWLGKGYVVDPGDLALADESVRRGYIESYEMFIKAGDYHSGPLSVIIPFGIWGVLGFIWFIYASIQVLWGNMRYGDSQLTKINTFLFSFFIGRFLFFLFFFGGMELELWLFCSIVGLSLSLNGGAKKAPEMPRLQFDSRLVRSREANLAHI